MKDTTRFISGDRTGAVVAGISQGTDDIITRDGYDGFITREQTGRI